MPVVATRTPARRSDPVVGALAINYSSDQDLSGYAVRGVYISTAGTLKVDMHDGTTVTFANLAAGTIYPIQITKIYTTGSSLAAGLVLL